MEITDKNPSINLKSYVKNIKDERKIANSPEKTSNEFIKEDKVVLSSKAKEIQEAKKILDSTPDVREKKITQLKKQIENGTYEIDGKKIAVKMIKESLLNEVL